MEHASRRFVRTSLAVTFLSMLGACEGQAEELAEQAAEQVIPATAPKIESVTLTGPGCGEPETYRVGITGTRDSFRIRFEDFDVSTRSATPPVSAECTVAVVLEGTEGVMYAPAGMAIEVRGSAESGTVSTTGGWAPAPDRVTSNSTTFQRGGLTTGALDDAQLWSSCSGKRELRFTTKLGIDASGSASVRRLSDLHFYSRPCRASAVDVPNDAAVGAGDAGQVDGGAGVDAASAPIPDAQVAVLDAGGAEGDSVSIASVTTAGAGCPGGTAQVHSSPSADGLEVDFPDFALASTPGSDRGSKACSVTVRLNLPAGKTAALRSLTMSGMATVSAGAIARVSAYSNWIGDPMSPEKLTVLTGPVDGSFDVDAEFAGDDLRFGRCAAGQGALSLNLALSYRASEDGASVRAAVSKLKKLRFATRDCN